MKTIALAPALALALAASAAQAIERPPLCESLYGLADAARQGGQPQRVTIIGGDRTKMTIGCRMDTGNPAGEAFCQSAIAAAGEFEDNLPWRLKSECLSTMAADPQVTTGAERAGPDGRKKITRLTAKLGRGVRLDVSAAGPGRYELVVWAPK